ncbi:MAG: hypothetical protein HQK53_13180 [Oligoflexia bacterium]|nr:hypothetical protein [Oligoflexia bacterium]
MNVISFIGSDKNAGKTTVFNYIYKEYRRKFTKSVLCLSSIGINGEELDSYEYDQSKPPIAVYAEDYFITRGSHLRSARGAYRILHIWGEGEESNPLILAQSLTAKLGVVLEGPNHYQEILAVKQFLAASLMRDGGYLLLDGSIDRQFLAGPKISDVFYYALLLSNRPAQLRKASDLLTPLFFPLAKEERGQPPGVKSLLYRGDETIYQGTEIAFIDRQLLEQLRHLSGMGESHGELHGASHTYTLYLNSALSPSLFALLGSIKNLRVILDNFTLYQNISTSTSTYTATAAITAPLPSNLYLLRPTNVAGIFWRMDPDNPIDYSSNLLLMKLLSQMKKSKKISVHNLFREDPDEIRIGTRSDIL